MQKGANMRIWIAIGMLMATTVAPSAAAVGVPEIDAFSGIAAMGVVGSIADSGREVPQGFLTLRAGTFQSISASLEPRKMSAIPVRNQIKNSSPSPSYVKARVQPSR
jgi:hypothetical protein